MDVYMVYKAAHAGRWNLLQYKSAKENKIKTFQVIQEPSFRWTMWSLLRTAQKKYMYCMMGYRDFNNCETKEQVHHKGCGHQTYTLYSLVATSHLSKTFY